MPNGRPTRRNGPKDTPERRKTILTALRAGNTRKASCAYAGVSEDTFALMLKRHSDFADAVEKAEADAEVRHVANIAKAAGEGVWTASAWWLERRRHEDWGRRDKVEILATVRELARAAGADEDAAVIEAERFLKEIRGSKQR